MQRVVRLTAGVLLILVWLGVCHAYTQGDPEWRGIFVQNGEVQTRAEIDKLLADTRACNANSVVVEMRAIGKTMYPSPYEPRFSGIEAGLDPLAYLITQAHSGSPRIEVQVWLWTWNVGSQPKSTDPNHPVYKYPQFLSKDDQGSDIVSSYYRFDPGHPEAEEYTYNVIMDVVNRYDVDAINLDNIRYGGIRAGYNEVSLERFNERYGRTGQPAYNDPEWSDWRRAQVTAIVRKVYANILATKPNVRLTADTMAGTFVPANEAEFASSSAYTAVYQDWLSWMQEGIIDMNLPMAYLPCGTSTFDNWTCFTRSHQYDRQAGMIIAAYSNTTDCIVSQLQSIRNLSCSGAPGAGASIFDYRSLDSTDMNAIRGVWTTPVAAPDMPWKSSPTKGHIKGSVTLGGNTWVDGAVMTLTGAVSRTITGDGTGFYAFIDLPPGAYTVTCASPDGRYSTKPCSVSAGLVTDLSFDFALPALSIWNVQVSDETPDSVTVAWRTNGASTSIVDYGLEPDCSLGSVIGSTVTTRHKVKITGLSPLTAYHFRVRSQHPDAPQATSPVSVFLTSALRPEIIIDNPSAVFTTTWTLTSLSDQRYGADYRFASLSSLRTATYTPNISVPGNYRVSEWHSEGSNRCTQVPHIVSYSGGTETIYVNQQANGARWNDLCVKPFAAGSSGNVQITNQAVSPEGSVVIADALKFTAILESEPPSVPLGLSAAVGQDYIDLNWTASTDNAGVAGYLIARDGLLVDSSSTTSYRDANLASNTRYAYSVTAYDTAGNKCGASSAINVWSPCRQPTAATVTCDKQAGVWHSSGPFTFTAVGGFGSGLVNYYRYAWDTSPSHTWTGTESAWVVGTRACAASASASPYYLHIRGYNGAAVPGEPADFGPYYLDDTAPAAPVVSDDGAYSLTQTSVQASWSATDPESGIIGCEYAVGTAPGGTNLVNWTSTTAGSAVITIQSQSPGTTVYVSARAQNGSMLWSDIGTSDGIKVAMAVAKVADAKPLSNTTVVCIADVAVSAVFSDCFYVQDLNRASGIRVEGSCPFVVGTRIDVSGILSVNGSGERCIIESSVALAHTGP